jgi:branched-chain amino acid transport system permease protein
MEHLTYYTQFFFSGLTVGSIYALVGLGFALVYNVSRVLNFAQGEFVMLGGMAMIYLVKALQLPIPLAFVLSILFVAVVGFLMDLIVIRPVQKGSFLIMILITIGISAFIQGIAGLVFGREHLSFPPLFFQGKVLSLFGAVFDPQVISIIAITVLASICLKIFLARSWDGKALRACGENKITAHLLGINVPYMRTLSFALSGALGALAGIMVTPICLMFFQGGVMLGLKGICGAVIGGLNNIWGALVGGLILGLSESFGVGIISSEYKDAIAFCILLLILFIKPEGLLGSKK